MKDLALRLIIGIFLIGFLSSPSLSQTTAVPFVLINISPEANGQGCSSVSRITDDNYSIITNPAHIGISSFQSIASFSFYPAKTDWLPGLGHEDLTLNTLAICGGLNLKEYTDIPLSVGIAYSRIYLNLGSFNRTSPLGPEPISTYNAEEHADAISIGIGADFGVQIALGITFKNIVSNLADQGAGSELVTGQASAWVNDYGLLLYLPITNLFLDKIELLPQIAPIAEVSFGTALTNVGGKLTYNYEAQAEPFPRNISIGTSFEIGFKYSPTNHKLFSFTWSRQSDNLLVGNDRLGSFYRGGYGDIDFFKNIVQGKRTETIDISQGWQFGIAEFLFIRGGSFVGTGNRSFKTEGIGIRFSGFLKLLKDLEVEETDVLSFLIKYIDIRYDESTYNTTEAGHPMDHTKFSSLSLIVKLLNSD